MKECKILIIEDDDSARRTLAKAVKKEGFDVVTAENGRIGLEVFEKESPQIIISDLKMPEVSGMEVVEKVKAMSPNVEIILVTGFGETDTAITALHHGVLDYIRKPIDLEQLSVALGRAKEKVEKHRKSEAYPTVLLAEDDETARTRLGKVLEKDGWTMRTASDGEEALDIFQQEKIDIVLLDIKMPKKDGLEALRQMREITDDFEAIILTGCGDEERAIKAMRGGAMNFLKKPIDLEQLIVLVEKANEKLMLTRSLKYRIRELELANEVIAEITENNELIIDVGSKGQKSSREFAQELIDVIQMGLIVFDEDLVVRNVNRHLMDTFENIPENIDEKFVKDLEEIGIVIGYAALIDSIERVRAAEMGVIETISVDQYAFIKLTPVILSYQTKKDKLILMIIRGKRSSNGVD